MARPRSRPRDETPANGGTPSFMLSREFQIAEEAARRQAELLADKLDELFTSRASVFQSAPRQQTDDGERVPTQTLVYLPNGTGTSGATLTVASESALWPLSVHVRLACSAAVADRTVGVEYQTADGERFDLYGSLAVVQASNTQSFIFHHTQGEERWPVEDAALSELGSQHLFPGQRLKIVVNNGDAGDVLDQIRVSVRLDPLALTIAPHPDETPEP